MIFYYKQPDGGPALFRESTPSAHVSGEVALADTPIPEGAPWGWYDDVGLPVEGDLDDHPRAGRKAFDPDQPRDDHGRFAGDGGDVTKVDSVAGLPGTQHIRPGSGARALLWRATTREAEAEPNQAGAIYAFGDRHDAAMFAAANGGHIESILLSDRGHVGSVGDFEIEHIGFDAGRVSSLRERGFSVIINDGEDTDDRGAQWVIVDPSAVIRNPKKSAAPEVADLAAFLAGIKALAADAKAKKPVSAEKIKKVVDSFDWDAWKKDMEEAVGPAIRAVAEQQAERTADSLGRVFDREDPFVDKHFTGYVGTLIKDLDKTSRSDVAGVIRSALEAGGSDPGAIGDMVGDLLREKFDGYADWRADRIARTEVANAYNIGTVLASRQAGVTKVEVLDGDDDEECAAANGQVWDLDYALEHPTAHPNCTRAFSPVPAEEQ